MQEGNQTSGICYAQPPPLSGNNIHNNFAPFPLRKAILPSEVILYFLLKNESLFSKLLSLQSSKFLPGLFPPAQFLFSPSSSLRSPWGREKILEHWGMEQAAGSRSWSQKRCMLWSLGGTSSYFLCILTAAGGLVHTTPLCCLGTPPQLPFGSQAALPLLASCIFLLHS